MIYLYSDWTRKYSASRKFPRAGERSSLHVRLHCHHQTEPMCSKTGEGVSPFSLFDRLWRANEVTAAYTGSASHLCDEDAELNSVDEQPAGRGGARPKRRVGDLGTV